MHIFFLNAGRECGEPESRQVVEYAKLVGLRSFQYPDFRSCILHLTFESIRSTMADHDESKKDVWSQHADKLAGGWKCISYHSKSPLSDESLMVMNLFML